MISSIIINNFGGIENEKIDYKISTLYNDEIED